MAETVLPDVYIEVRAEGLIAPTQITVGRMGIVGTASRGPLLDPQTLSSAQDARRMFGEPDAFEDNQPDELTLTRAIELAYLGGATTVFGVRVSGLDNNDDATAVASTHELTSLGGTSATLTAATPGTWGDDLTVEVTAASRDPYLRGEEHAGAAAVSLEHTPVLTSARNRIRLFRTATGATSELEIVTVAPANDDQVQINLASGALTFGPTALDPADVITASYVVGRASARDVKLAYRDTEETFTILDGNDLAAQLAAPGGSELATAEDGSNPDEPPNVTPDEAAFSNGEDGVADARYDLGLEALLTEEAHIIVAAGRDADTIGDDLAAHCTNASTDAIKLDRIAVVGSGLGDDADATQATADLLGSDRLILVAPGVVKRDDAADPPADTTLPGAYAAAAVGGLIASLPAHVSATNKVVGGAARLEFAFNSGELAELVGARVLTLTQRQGIRVVKGITTSTNTAFSQITTRRIVDFAKYGVRSAANPYIGLLNNERVRGALRATINSFLAQMVLDEMLVSYDLDVTATREEERQGIARVTMTLRPTFSIDFIKVTMFLE